MNKENEAEHRRQTDLDEARARNEEAEAVCCDDCRYREDCENKYAFKRCLQQYGCEDYEEKPRIKNRAAKEGI